MGYYQDTSNNIYLYTVTKSGVVTTKLLTASSTAALNGMINDSSYVTGVFKLNNSDTTIYKTGLAMPSINTNGVRGYMKIASN